MLRQRHLASVVRGGLVAACRLTAERRNELQLNHGAPNRGRAGGGEENSLRLGARLRSDEMLSVAESGFLQSTVPPSYRRLLADFFLADFFLADFFLADFFFEPFSANVFFVAAFDLAFFFLAPLATAFFVGAFFFFAARFRTGFPAGAWNAV